MRLLTEKRIRIVFLRHLIGECKWTNDEDASRLYNRLASVAKALPFAKRKQVHIALFTKVKPEQADGLNVFLPSDVLI